MQLIQTISLGSSQNGISFQNIPQGYSDLLLLLSLRSNQDINFFLVSFNGVTTGFTSQTLVSTGSTILATTPSINGVGGGSVVNSTYTASTFSNVSMYIPDYSNSLTTKVASIDSVTENNSTTSFQNTQSLRWLNTSAISSISIYLSSTNTLTSNSSVSLYGISRGSDGRITVI